MPQPNVRRRVRRTVSNDWDHRIRIRFYCPVCGEVRGPSRWTMSDVGHDGKNLVYPHHRPYWLGPSEKCPGGRVDPVKDRAP